MAHNPVGAGFTVSSNQTSVKSDPFAHKTNTLRVVSYDKNGHIAIGTEPTATHTNYALIAGVPETLDLGPARSTSVVGIVTGTTTYVDFPQGTGSPFSIGDYVTLTVTNNGQSYYNFTHQPVVSVNNYSGVGGYYSTRIGIGTNTSGIVTAFDPNSSAAELRNSLKIAFLSDGGASTAFCQQVQISGQA